MTQKSIVFKAARVVRVLDFLGAVVAFWLVGKSFFSGDWMMFAIGLVGLAISIACVVYQPILLGAQAVIPWAAGRANPRAKKASV